jgi:hypothetical protein
MSSTFFRVSGIDSNDGARIVFVWCRNKGPDDYALLGAGHVVSGENFLLLPGVSVGQFSVVFALPDGCSPDDVVVTDDKNGNEPLLGVALTPCLTPMGFRFEAAVPGDLAELNSKINAPVGAIDHGQTMSALNSGATS